MKILIRLTSSDPIHSLLKDPSDSKSIPLANTAEPSVVQIFLKLSREIHLDKIVLVLLLSALFLQALRIYWKLCIAPAGIYSKTSSNKNKTNVRKDLKTKKAQLVSKSDDGLGYWVEGYGDEVSYVPLTALYPEGTDMDEIEKLKRREPQ